MVTRMGHSVLAMMLVRRPVLSAVRPWPAGPPDGSAVSLCVPAAQATVDAQTERWCTECSPADTPPLAAADKSAEVELGLRRLQKLAAIAVGRASVAQREVFARETEKKRS